MRTDIDLAKEEIIAALQSGIPQAAIAKKLGCKIDTLKSRLNKWGVSNLKNPNRKGMPHGEAYRPASEYFDNSKFIKSHTLKLKLIKDGFKQHQCENCLNTEWMGQPIPIELDHIDGNHYNNALENLRILCPNCHAQTPTNSGKNIGKRHCSPIGRRRVT